MSKPGTAEFEAENADRLTRFRSQKTGFCPSCNRVVGLDSDGRCYHHFTTTIWLRSDTATDAIRQIEHLNLTTNQGRGSSVARRVVSELKRDDLKGAVLIWQLDADKVVQYPDMYELMETLLGPRNGHRG